MFRDLSASVADFSVRPVCRRLHDAAEELGGRLARKLRSVVLNLGQVDDFDAW